MKIVEANRCVARRAIEEIWNHHDLDIIDLLVAANYVAHDPRASALPDREGFKQLVGQAVAAAPNARLTIDLMLAEGDRVALRYTVHNGQRCTTRGTSPQIRQAGTTGALHLRIVRGQLRESWGVARMAELLCRAGGTAT